LKVVTSPTVLVLKEELHAFDKYFQHAPTDVGQSDSVSSKHLLWHLAGAFLDEGWKKGADVIKEDNVRWMFDQLGWYFNSVLGSRENDALWVLLSFYDLFILEVTSVVVVLTGFFFKLIVIIESERKKYCYTPRSHFHISVDGFQSDKNERDRYRILLQAACAARLGRRLFNDNPFIVVALYVRREHW
jgi:hypothetical protein